jgi:hypothetical protein
MTHALKGARRPRQSDRVLFEDAHFSDIWNDAQHLRTAIVRAHVQSLIRRIRRALINPGSMRHPSMHRDLTHHDLAQAGMSAAKPVAKAGADLKTDRRKSADREKSSLAGGLIDGSGCT